MSYPLISIITVCKNAQDSISNTINSVLSQSYPNLEYIIIDAISNDNTLEIINQHVNLFILKNITFKIISEDDLGIYDGMNKGVLNSNGEWLYFLNSGDLIYDKNTINIVFKNSYNFKTDFVYGNTLIKNKNSTIYPPPFIKKYFFYQDTICHQSIFIKKNVFEKFGYFNLTYKIISDRVLFYNAFLNKCKFQYINLTISIWEEEGFSSSNISLFSKEEVLFRKTYFKFNLIIFIKLRNIVKFLSKKLIIK